MFGISLSQRQEACIQVLNRRSRTLFPFIYRHSLKRQTVSLLSRPATVYDKRQRTYHAQVIAISPEVESDPRVGDQVNQVATILSSHSEAITAINVQIFKAALIGTSSDQQGSDSPEMVLEAVHSAVLSVLQDRAHLMGVEERENWSKANWDVFHVVQPNVQRVLFGLYTLAAEMGSSAGALQAADCLSNGLLIPHDSAAALQWYEKASDLGSAAASLKCGVLHFQGHPAARGSSKAYSYFRRALEQAELAVEVQQERLKQREAAFDKLADAQQAALVEEDQAYLEFLLHQRDEAVAWVGRCYAGGAGVARDLGLAAKMFKQSGSLQDLRDLHMLKEQLDCVDFSEINNKS